MIISHWSIKKHHGLPYFEGQAIDTAGLVDGTMTWTSPIIAWAGKAFMDQSGHIYNLGCPGSQEQHQYAAELRTQLHRFQNPLEAPFKAIIENWSTAKTQGGALVVHGQAYGMIDSNDEKPIRTSPIFSRDGNMVVTSSGSRYVLATPSSELISHAKQVILSQLHQFDAPIPVMPDRNRYRRLV